MVLLAPAAWGAAVETWPPAPRAIPRITLQNLSPPYLDHDYFRHHRRFPFEAHATAFSLVNAWWLAEAATLVYADEDFARPRLHQAGLDPVCFFDRAGTQGFIAANRRFALVVFRGSEIWRRSDHLDLARMTADLRTNIDLRRSAWAGGGKVHSGFLDALDAVWGEIDPVVAGLQARGLPVWVTGHSLGAALATLAADRWATVQGVYTFGSPRVGDAVFQERYRPRAFRLVNGRDIVASVPPPGLFHHVGERMAIGPGGVQSSSPQVSADAADDLGHAEAPADGTAGERLDSGVFIPDPVRDHVAFLYPLGLWNALVRQRPPAAADNAHLE